MSSTQAKGAPQIVQNLRNNLANVSRTILDSLFSSNDNLGKTQQLLNDIAAEIVVEQLENVCYETRTGNNDKEETFVNIDDIKHKEEFIQLLKLFSELTRGCPKHDEVKAIDRVKE